MLVFWEYNRGSTPNCCTALKGRPSDNWPRMRKFQLSGNGAVLHRLPLVSIQRHREREPRLVRCRTDGEVAPWAFAIWEAIYSPNPSPCRLAPTRARQDGSERRLASHL